MRKIAINVTANHISIMSLIISIACSVLLLYGADNKTLAILSVIFSILSVVFSCPVNVYDEINRDKEPNKLLIPDTHENPFTELEKAITDVKSKLKKDFLSEIDSEVVRLSIDNATAELKGLSIFIS